MKKFINKFVTGAVTAVYTAAVLLGTASAAQAADTSSSDEYPYPSLYKTYGDYFDISVAVEPSDLTKYPELAKEQFNVIVPENQMKAWIQKGENSWYWTGADQIVAFAEANGKKIRMHTLVCPDQYDGYSKNELKWFYCDEDGNFLFDDEGNVIDLEAAQALTLKRLEFHIKTIMERYKGRIYAYDVVNEAYQESGRERTYTKFSKLLDGVDWVTKCFEWAHEADPDAVLIYNDNGFTSDIVKQNVIYEKIKALREAGIPAQIGMQMHYSIDVNMGLVENLIAKFSDLCDIYVTELDMGVYVSKKTGNILTDSNGFEYSEYATVEYPDFMYGEASEIQARKYAGLFDIFRKYSDSIKAVGFWNICDGRTFRGGQKPLVFDENSDPKAAFYRIIDFDEKLPRTEASDRAPSYRGVDYVLDRESGKVIVKGTTAGSKVEIKLYNSGYDADIDSSALNNSKYVLKSGDYTAELAIKPDSTAAERYHEYTLVVSQNEGTYRETFNYYTDEEVKDGFVIHDPLNDFSKMHIAYNLKTMSCLDFYEKDAAGIGVSNTQLLKSVHDPQLVEDVLEGSYAVYKIPDGFMASGMIIDSFPYEFSLWNSEYAKPDVYVSPDGITWTKISNDSTTWGSEIAKVYKKDEVMPKQRRHFIGTLENIASGMKYVKLDLSRYKTNWHIYIADIKLSVVPDPSYTEPDKADIEVSDLSLYAKTSHGNILSGVFHGGSMSAGTTVTNNTDAERTIMFAAAVKKSGTVVSTDTDTKTVAAGETAVFEAEVEGDSPRYGDTAELFLFDVTDSGQKPLIEKAEYRTGVTSDMYFRDSLESFDKMNAHSETLELLDGTASSFSDTTLLQQAGDWNGGYIEYKAKDGKKFRRASAVLYTNLPNETEEGVWTNCTSYGTPYIAVSDDGVSFTDILGGKSEKGSLAEAGWKADGRGSKTYGTSGYWFFARKAAADIPNGAKYVRVGIPSSVFNKHHIKLGEVEMICDDE